MALDPAKRKIFVDSCVHMLDRYFGFPIFPVSNITILVKLLIFAFPGLILTGLTLTGNILEAGLVLIQSMTRRTSLSFSRKFNIILLDIGFVEIILSETSIFFCRKWERRFTGIRMFKDHPLILSSPYMEIYHLHLNILYCLWPFLTSNFVPTTSSFNARSWPQPKFRPTLIFTTNFSNST